MSIKRSIADSKQPILIIEVDGYAFHRQESKQSKRDQIKDSILKKYNLPILRLSTTGSSEGLRVEEVLKQL